MGFSTSLSGLTDVQDFEFERSSGLETRQVVRDLLNLVPEEDESGRDRTKGQLLMRLATSDIIAQMIHLDKACARAVVSEKVIPWLADTFHSLQRVDWKDDVPPGTLELKGGLMQGAHTAEFWAQGLVRVGCETLLHLKEQAEREECLVQIMDSNFLFVAEEVSQHKGPFSRVPTFFPFEVLSFGSRPGEIDHRSMPYCAR